MENILNIVEYLSNDKSINKNKVFDIIESIVKYCIKKKFNNIDNIKIELNRNTGFIKIFRILKIIDNINILDENSNIYIKNIDNNNKYIVGDLLKKEIKDIKFNRIIIQQAKNFILKKIDKLEKLEIFNKYKNFINKIFICIVKKIYTNKVLLFIDNNIEGIILNKDLIYSDKFKINDKFRGILYLVKNTKYGIQLFINRNNIKIIEELFKKDISEINNNIIKIMSISREPGLKSKIAVKSNNKNINPIYFFIISKKSILKSISNELNNEYIDIILWDSDLLKFIKNSIYPINIKSISLNENNKNVNILVDKNDIPKIIGKNGINIKLISLLVNFNINISYIKNNFINNE